MFEIHVNTVAIPFKSKPNGKLLVETKYAIIHGTFEIFSSEKHKVYKNG